MRVGALVLVTLQCAACASARTYPHRMSTEGPYAELSVGTMARVQLVSNRVASGGLVQSGLDSVAVRVASGERYAFAASEIRSIRIEATGTNSGTGAIAGLLIGGVVGAALGVAAGDACSVSAYATCSSGSSAAGGALLFGAVGAGAGALLGRTVRTSKWVGVPGPWRVVP